MKDFTYQCRLAGALHAVESEEEGCGVLATTFILLSVQPQPLENEGDAVFRLVIDDLRHVAIDSGVVMRKDGSDGD